MKNRSIITVALSSLVLLSGAALGWERLLSLSPFATSSEHDQLAEEVGENTIAILENEIAILDGKAADVQKTIWEIDMIEYKAVLEDGSLPPPMFEQRLQLQEDKLRIENELTYVRETLRGLSRWSIGAAALPRSAAPSREGRMP